MIIIDDRVRPLAEYPLRFAELCLCGTERPHTVLVPQVEVPPVRTIRSEDQIVIQPARLQRGFAGTSRDGMTVHDRGTAQIADHDRGGVPRHVRMVPLSPSHSPTGRELRCGVEIGAGAQYRTPVEVRTIKIKSHDGVDRFAANRMVLAHSKYQSPVVMGSNVAESKGALRRDRLGFSSAPDCVQATVAELRIDHRATRDVVLAASILVHSVAHEGRSWGHLDELTTGNEPPPQTCPASFGGAGLQPVDVPPIDLHGRESD